MSVNNLAVDLAEAGRRAEGLAAAQEAVDLRRELVGFARSHLGPAVAPRQLDFDQHLPHTRSGKIMRRLLRARALGLPTGDLSTLEQPT